MIYETEGLLHHLMWHQNMAPFIAYRLIQRMVTSNPSPRYTKAVADAFHTGSYDGVVYSGARGDLAAAVHAILLDREARSVTLDLDPSHGQLREPLMRVRRRAATTRLQLETQSRVCLRVERATAGAALDARDGVHQLRRARG